MASSNSESHADGLLSRLRRIPNFFAELKCDRVQAFAYNGDIHKLVLSFKTSDAFIEFWGVPQDCFLSEPPCSAAHSAFTFDNLLQAANLVATAFLHRCSIFIRSCVACLELDDYDGTRGSRSSSPLSSSTASKHSAARTEQIREITVEA